jgi:hypothetical protein
MASKQQPIILTQTGVPDPTGADGDTVGAALGAGLANLPATTTPTTGMVLKLVNGVVGWYPARNQVPPIPYQAPIVTSSTPVGTGVLANLTSTAAMLNLMLTEQQRLVASYNTLLEQLAANGYMLPKPTA